LDDQVKGSSKELADKGKGREKRKGEFLSSLSLKRRCLLIER